MAAETYKGRPEKNPGKMQFRYKGYFRSEKRAREAQERLKAQGLKTKVVLYNGKEYALYVMAKHDFWGRSFIYDTRFA